MAALETTPQQRFVSRIIACLMLAGIIISAAGIHHQRTQRDAAVNWQQVSTALLEVETAKLELHQALQTRVQTDQHNAN